MKRACTGRADLASTRCVTCQCLSATHICETRPLLAPLSLSLLSLFLPLRSLLDQLSCRRVLLAWLIRMDVRFPFPETMVLSGCCRSSRHPSRHLDLRQREGLLHVSGSSSSHWLHVCNTSGSRLTPLYVIMIIIMIIIRIAMYIYIYIAMSVSLYNHKSIDK